ncbi:MAG: hypoxanthine phosphoribosyltransferase [Deltaproteobacteria bacterium]|nr:hypoxanthine phosphoribosyltransferase [Deltaproteobacteria bacterium]
MTDLNLKPYISQEQIEKAVQKLADQINKDYKGQELICVGVLKGSFMFLSDLVKKLKLEIHIDFVRLSSYQNNKTSSGTVVITKDIESSITGKRVLIIEEILDSGRTLDFLMKRFLVNTPHSVKICVLLDKREKRVTPVEADYVGLKIEDRFVVGYGLDYQEKYRNLPEIYYV